MREAGHGCRACKACNSESFCFCFKCGFTSQNVTANKYASMVRDLESNAMDLEEINRYISCAVEDTYCPIWQTFMVFPQISEKFFQLPQSDASWNRQAEFYSSLSWTLVSVMLSILAQAMAIADMHFSKRKKEHLGTKFSVKCLFLFAIIFQISSRLLTISVFGMFMFPENPYTPLILTGFCFIHILIVFTSRYVIGMMHFSESFGTPISIVNCMLCAFGSVFSYAKIYFDKENRFISDIENEEEQNIDHGKAKPFKNMVQEKFWQRLIFGVIIVVEQLTMYILIIYWGSVPTGFNVKLFILVTGAIFITGHLTESILHLFFNPFARFRPYYKIKKIILCLVAIFFVMSVLGYILHFLYIQYVEKKE